MTVHTSDDRWLNAPVETVFAFMDEPSNQAAVTPSLTRAERIERLPNAGNRAAYEYTMFGLTFTGEVQASTYEPPARIVYEMHGDLTGRIAWRFEPEDGGTRLTYAADYEVPGPLPEALLAPLIRWYNRREVRRLLDNVAEAVEGKAQATTA
ncbi:MULTISPECIES: SRPBCC family protein [unclassified Haloarcula]|uniref:SRPBCC family protein n=1 Tax=unclassified Haloarcula TaxID=2624677 RepID=UPI000EF14E0C|nr:MULTISPECIES: SRPBCC family protein [unclassified Haloarcula]RLM33787.1 SRPBCC family protein [Haloarcula sp. Atlit-120R]RLM95811.1 SRPBCC family protein [Haloarcula sp. Atlit-7R]